MRFLPRLRFLLPVFAICCISLGALAQPDSPPSAAPQLTPAQRVDQARATLDQVEKALSNRTLSDAQLAELRGQIDPIETSATEVVAQLTPILAGIKARLDQLGAKPADNAPAESAPVTAERAEQQKKLSDVDEVLKRARLIAVQADQTADHIGSRRRELFTSALFQRTNSLFGPSLWGDVARDLPRDARGVEMLASDFWSNAADRLTGWWRAAFAAMILALIAVYVAASRISRRVVAHEPSIADPTRFRKVRAALWVGMIVAVAPLASVTLFFALFNSFGLLEPRLEPLVHAIIVGVVRIALAAGLARALLQRSRPNWRLIDVSDSVAEKISRLAITVACIVSATRILETLSAVVGATLPVSVFTRGLGALFVAFAMAVALYGIISEPDDTEECLGPRVDTRRDWYAPLRFAAWGAILVLIASVAVGYIALAAFVVDQIVWIACVGSVLYLVLALIQEVIASSFKPTAPLGRSLMASVGIKRESLEQIAILLSGGLHVALFCIAALLVLAPWGVQSDDLASSIRAAFFGVTLGGVTISLSSLVFALVVFALVYGATRGLQYWLETRYLPHTNLDTGLRNSIKTSLGYVGFIIAVALALGYLGLSFEKLAIVAGALSLGIGFGLQSIVNNFVSGLILLWERAIRVGDWIVVGDEQGFVRRINVRSTEIETFDRAMMIVPNSNLITGVVKNWVRTDRVGRLKISLSVQSGADPEKVRELLIGAAKAHDLILSIPAPQVLLTSLEAAAYKYDLLAYVDDVETSQRVKSELLFEIHRRFKAANLSLGAPAAPTIVELADIGRLENLLSGQRPESPRRAGGKS
ncbi:MAG: potassium-dependent mechanosensitive channel [Methylobacteriaceae bacterium]|jgi:small-conductance mechanosensitive channel|nr:potassium-dependent mechanosensitive channel [Methylobacteriaceae bacterium]